MTETKAPLYEYNRITGQRNLHDEVVEIISSDIDTVVDGTKESGGFITALTFLLVSPLTLLKLLHCTWTLCFDNKKSKGTSLSEIFRDDLSYPDEIGRYSEDEIIGCHAEIEKFEECSHPYIKSKRKAQETTDSLILIRDVLLSNKNKLNGYKIKTIQRKVADEILEQDAKTGNISTAYWTDYIDFGENLNKCLNKILPENIKLKKIKELPYKCVEVHNSDLFSIEENLKRIFLQNDLKICISD